VDRKNNKNTITNLIYSISGQKAILAVPRVFVEMVGSLNTAFFLSQALYWSDRGKHGWFYKTYTDWEAELALSKYQVRQAVAVLKKRGVIETKVKKAAGNPTVHYRMNINRLAEWIIEHLSHKNKAYNSYHEKNKDNARQEAITEGQLKTIADIVSVGQIGGRE